jgi:cyclic beta-1,2-glucan synthetase
VAVTGDVALWDESVPFLEGRLLDAKETEAYELPGRAAAPASLFEHCVRAIDHAITTGPHGLPLMGSGDWNDGMNRVGRDGRGESVWLGFFLGDVLRRFADLCTARGDVGRAQHYRGEVARLGPMLELAWDGEWYRRGYFDDGTPLGSAQNEECRIDSLPQTWAVLSGLAPARRAEQALDAVRTHLMRRPQGLILLLTPPFDRAEPDPGYIRGYPPGIRENGGQYTHGAVWAVLALARMGAGDEAVEMFHPEPDQPRAKPRAHSATAASPTSSPATCTRIRCTPAARAGRGTRALPPGCIARGSRASSASSERTAGSRCGRASRRRGSRAASCGRRGRRASRSSSRTRITARAAC